MLLLAGEIPLSHNLRGRPVMLEWQLLRYLLTLATFGEIELLTVFRPFVPPGGPDQTRFLDYDASLRKGPNPHHRTSIFCSYIDAFHEDRRANSYTTRQVLHCRAEGILATL